MLDLLVPARCAVCESTYPWGPRPLWELLGAPPLCPACRAAIRPQPRGNRCKRCSIPLPQFVTVCERCRREERAFVRVIAAHRYAGVPAMTLQRLKFARLRSLAGPVAHTLARLVDEHTPAGAPLVPAPSSRRTIRRRGFAGAELIAAEVARVTHRPVLRLLDVAGARTQKALAYAGRQTNAANAIQLRKHAADAVSAWRRGYPRASPLVVLLDDVLTTGATANSCALRLSELGLETVVIVFAMEY